MILLLCKYLARTLGLCFRPTLKCLSLGIDWACFQFTWQFLFETVYQADDEDEVRSP